MEPSHAKIDWKLIPVGPDPILIEIYKKTWNLPKTKSTYLNRFKGNVITFSFSHHHQTEILSSWAPQELPRERLSSWAPQELPRERKSQNLMHDYSTQYPLIDLLYMALHMTKKIPQPSEMPSDASALQIRWFRIMNHSGKIVLRSRNSTECVLHHSSRTVTPWFCFEELIARSQEKKCKKSISHSFFDSEARWKALHPCKGPFAHDARKTSRCWGLWGTF